MEEIWKDIDDYEGLYQVSNFGRVRSLDRYVDNNGGKEFRPGRILKGRKSKKGYIRVGLSKDGIHTDKQVHYLVLSVFNPNPNPDKYTQINHINEDKGDNRLCNLEWCTPKYNCNYGTRNERFTETKFNNYIKEHPEYDGMSKEDIVKERSKRHYYENREKILNKMKEQYVHKSDVHKMTVTHWTEVNGKRVWY